MTDKREKLIARIRALRAKAADSAATEAEAQQAAELAAKLLMQHDLNESELDEGQREDKAELYGTVPSAALHHVQRATARAIEALTETVAFTDSRETLRPRAAPSRTGSLFDNEATGGAGWETVKEARVCFVGLPADVEMAIYLSEMLRGAAQRGWMDAYQHTPIPAGRNKRVDVDQFKQGYFVGFAERVSQRLRALARDRIAARPKGTDLVVSKRGLIESCLRDHGIHLRSKSYADPVGSQAGRAAGQAHGDRVGLGRPVGAADGPAMIGR